jgi:hypothetical protein
VCSFTHASSGIEIPSLWFALLRPDVYHCAGLIILGIKTQCTSVSRYAMFMQDVRLRSIMTILIIASYNIL